ncbi:WG repeat-containing protein [Achromobacter agilis]|nr:WG repeat-containing protein [Achromobacter agilis]
MLMTALLTTLALASGNPAAFELSCEYSDKTDEGVFNNAEHCAREENGGIVFNPEYLRRMQFGDDGLAPAGVAGNWRWVRQDGRSVAVLTYDNSPDEFEEGLSRGRRPEGMAYYDKQLNLALATSYAWAEPFSGGLAAVCSHCVIVPEPGGEHSMVVGGDWGAIDRQGRLVLPLRPDADSLRRELKAARAR